MFNLLTKGIALATNGAGGGGGGGGSAGGNDPTGGIPYDIPKIGEKDLNLPTNLTDLLEKLTSFLQQLAIPVAVALYLWAAFLYLTSAGEAEKIKRANQAVLYTTVGLIVVLIAHGLALVVKNIFAPDLPV